MNSNISKHVAVIGGGFAGLTAAYELHTSGFAVTVLEARQRLGGRVWSAKMANGAIVELGGEWISSGDPTVIKMAKKLNLPLVELGIDFKIREVVGGPAVSPDDQRETVQIAAKTLAAMDKKRIARTTVGEFVELLPVSHPQKELLRCRLQGSYGHDLDDIALRMLGDYSLGPKKEYFRIATGNQSLAKAMAAGLPEVRLGHVVTAIAHDQHGVSVIGRKNGDAFKIEADAVVTAIPVKGLAELEFNPDLPKDTIKAISSVPMGIAAKLAAGTKKKPPLRAVQDVDVPYWCWSGKGEEGAVRPTVTAFCGSKQAQQTLATNSDDPTIWLNKVQSAFHEVDFMDDAIMVDWSQDEWARGCYSAFDNGATDLIPFLSQPVGRIFFAGEHTAVESGTMEGALTSGLQVARQVLGAVANK